MVLIHKLRAFYKVQHKVNHSIGMSADRLHAILLEG